MFNTLIDIAIKAGEVIALMAVIGCISIAGLITLQQIGKNNRSIREKFSNKGHKLKRGILKRVALNAIENDDDEVVDLAINNLGDSYITTFGNDVIRGAKVVFSSCTNEDKAKKRNKL